MADVNQLSPDELQQYYDASDGIRLSPGWVNRERTGSPEIEPFLWSWSEVQPLVLKSGEIVTPDRDVERHRCICSV